MRAYYGWWGRIYLSSLAVWAIAGGCNGSDAVTADPAAEAALLPASLYFVSDGDGQAAPAGTQMVLMFEPGGVADLLVDSADAPSGHTGRYVFDGHTLALTFTASDFHHDVRAALDVSKPTVTLPFAMLSAGGSSTWSVAHRGVVRNLYNVFNGAFFGDQLTAEAALDRAVAYASKMDTFRLATPGVTKIGPNALEVCFTIGGCLWVNLYNRAFDATPPTADVTPSAILTGDSLNELMLPKGVPVVDTSHDPLEKWALFVIPFKSERERIYSTGVHDAYVSVESWDQALRKTSAGHPAEYGYDDIETFVGKNDYAVDELADDNATVVNLIRRMLPAPIGTHAHSPGVLLFDSHGSKDGALLTADGLNVLHPEIEEDDEKAWGAAFTQFVVDLANQFPDSDYPGFAAELLATDPADKNNDRYLMFQHQVTFAPDGGGVVHSIAINPTFWSWLRSHGADFSRSLVYIGACDTDVSEDLRNAIRARAYFAWSAKVPSSSTTIFYYLAQNLIRHTHSAEEAYYNVLRVLRTTFAIYPEDYYLDAFSHPSCNSDPEENPCVIGTREALARNFHGYSSDSGGVPVNYLSEGWLTDPKPGNIWWLLWKSRWFTQSGMAQSLLDCWTNWWGPPNYSAGSSTGDTCWQEAPGEAPTEDEVGYTSYLDIADPVLPTALSLTPRWTWHDSVP